MAETKIKVCGMTDPSQAATVSKLGIDAIGMILYANSPRCISLEQARGIRESVPTTVKLIGVFVDAPKAFVDSAIDVLGLDAVQLHGSESDEYGQSLNKPFIKAIRAKSRDQVVEEIGRYPSAEAILLDPYVKGQHGGTGHVLDISLWPEGLKTKGILAGGLSPANVEQRIAKLNPAMVDLNSGVEISPGQKSLALVEESVRIVRSL